MCEWFGISLLFVCAIICLGNNNTGDLDTVIARWIDSKMKIAPEDSWQYDTLLEEICRSRELHFNISPRLHQLPYISSACASGNFVRSVGG